MSNVTGAILDTRRVVDAARTAGALTLFDGCQAVVHLPVDVQAMGCDFYVFSGHKLFGPTGIGALYGREAALAELAPYQGGGEMIGTVAMDAITYADPPHRFEAGTPPILEAIGWGAALDWFLDQDRAAIAAHEHALYDRAVERLAGQNWLRILGASPTKGAILSFTVEGAHAHDVAQLLDRYGVAVRAGTHCAEPLMRRFGVTSSARASFALYNTLEEAGRLRRRPDQSPQLLRLTPEEPLPMDDRPFDPQISEQVDAPVARDLLDVSGAASSALMEDASSNEEASALPQEELDRLTDALVAQLKTVYDPEIPVDIYELGLIYKVDVSDERDVLVEMTLTAPGCPVAGDMPGWVQDAVEKIEGIQSCKVELTFDPPWDPSRMSDEAKLQLNMF